MKILIIAEHNNQILKTSTLNAYTAAQQISDEIDILVIGNACQNSIEQAAKIAGIKKVLVAESAVYEHQLAENLAPLIADVGKSYDYIIAPDTTFGKNILPRVAALLDVAMIADVIKIIEPTIFVRPIYAGNALTTVQSNDAIKILTIRTTAFSAATFTENTVAPIIKIEKVYENNLSTFINEEIHVSTRPELSAAKIVISGGRGLKSAENFKLLEALADKLGAAIGASRAAVDAGFAANDCQVGQTGKVVAPELYIAIGISGAIQHLAGMKDSKTIVAINNDPDAPIFQIADYGLVADLFTSLTELQTELDK
ncbi:MAG: FAD-binding protein [Gammaproteobacteria bacterium]|nr:FAD-binding protein [Gammaproteobacteria bacterium]